MTRKRISRKPQPKDSDLLEDIWAGWTDFWRETLTLGRGQTYEKTPRRAVKQLTLRKVNLKRDVAKKTRPRPKYIETEWDTEPRPEPEPEDVTDEYSTRVNPPKQFALPKETIETPQERTERIQKKQEMNVKRKKLRLSTAETVSKKGKHLLFTNPGTDKINELHKAMKLNLELPKWAVFFENQLTFDSKNVYFEGKLLATQEDKQRLIKRMYYDPKGPSTIHPITNQLRKEWANISKGNVRKILRTFETYQLNFRRRRPPKIMGKMQLKGPGIIMMDMFFPSKLLGWRKSNCLTCMDAWSRFVRVYVLESKKKELQVKAMNQFLQEFASTGHLPKYVLCDRGSDLRGAYEAIERYRTKPGRLVFHSKTGQPVQLVESTQAQIQRRMQVFRTAGLTDDPSIILEDICDSLNMQRRPERGNLTPIQLLTLDKAQRERINEDYSRKSDDMPEVKGLQPLFKGNRVRVLLWTMKEQLTNSKKGFTPKWSRDIWTIKKMVRLAGNPNNFRYFLKEDNDREGYFRHELLKIPKALDDQPLDMTDWKKSKIVRDDESEQWK